MPDSPRDEEQTPTVTELRRALNLLDRPALANGLPSVLLMTDDERLRDPVSVVRRMAPGCGVIVRSQDDERRRALATELLPVCRERGLTLLVAADPALARDVGADGLHLPERMVTGDTRWRRDRRAGWFVTAAAHSATAVRRAADAGCHAALVAPVFSTASHPDAAPLGPGRFAALCRESRIPLYALGGVGRHNIRRLAHSGCAGIAGIEGIAGMFRGDGDGP